MSTIQNIQDGVALRARDTALAEITSAQIIQLINDAARDAASRGWLIPLSDNTSLTYVTSTYTYTVPASFAYIRDLLDDDALINRWNWDMRLISSNPTIVFQGEASDIRIANSSVITVVGYKKPKDDYSAVGDTVDAGIEAFLRERALVYTLDFMTAGTSELDRLRERARERAARDAETMLLDRQEVEKRLVPILRQVPGR